jgi:hypothetical protein
MHPLYTIPVGIGSFLLGIMVAAPSRKGLTMQPRSPLKGVRFVLWSRYVGRMARHPKQYDSPRGRMGMFGMDARRLCDIGFAVAPRKVTIGRETGVWTADFRAPVTKNLYLARLPLQYASFKRSMHRMQPVASEFVGAEVDGEKCTLSGLLGVGHMAGEAGIKSWVKDPKVRQRFKATTDTFKLTNGIF